MMDYDRLFQRASRGLNGSGGGSGGGDIRDNRGYQAVNMNDDYSPTRQIADGFTDYLQGRNPVQHPRSSLGGATVVSFANSQHSPAVQLISGSHTTISMPLSTVGPVPTLQLTTSPDVPGLNLAHIDTEWERRGSRCSNKSHNSKGSGKASNRFLGVHTGSAWTRWSRERRASYRRRIEKLTREEPVPPTPTVVRISTPIKKARQEGLKFMHPDLEGTYLSEDDINELRRHKQQQVHVMRVIERNRRNKYRRATEVKLSPEQWHMLQEFWDHALFVRARYLGVLASLVAFIFMMISITSHSWVKHSTWNLTIVEGLWWNCTQPTVIPNASEGCTPSNGRNWQNGIIGLMIFAATFGFLASVLSICGVCTNPLPRKIYYFHSAGEIFLICAVSASIALIVFPLAVELDSSIQSHRYGLGYGLGWGGAFFFLAAAICMSLDDLVRESSRAKCCRWCWRGKHNDRNDLRQV